MLVCDGISEGMACCLDASEFERLRCSEMQRNLFQSGAGSFPNEAGVLLATKLEVIGLR